MSKAINTGTCSPHITYVDVSTPTGANGSGENITAFVASSDGSGNNATISYDWRRNQESIAILNMDFNTNNSAGPGRTIDISTTGNNGTENGAVWESTGYIGGSYDFTNDRIDLTSTTLSSDFTIMFWENLDASLSNDDVVLGDASSKRN